MSKKHVLSDNEFYQMFNNQDSLTPEQKSLLNAHMKFNNRRKIALERKQLLVIWLKSNWLALVACLISVAAFVKSFF